MPAVLLPLLTALTFTAGAVFAYTATPRSSYGDAYGHVANHLISAGLALLVAVSVLALARRSTTARARRRGRWLSGAWGLVSAAFVLDAIGGGIGDRSGDYAIHDVAMLLVATSALLVLATTLLVTVAPGGWAPWPLRLSVLVSAPALPALGQAASAPSLSLGLAAGAVWFVLAAHAATALARRSAVSAAAEPVPLPSHV